MTRPPTVAEVRDQKLMAPAREQKLPPWAQETIQALRAELGVARDAVRHLEAQRDTLEARIAEAATANTGPENSTAWLWRETGGEELPALGLGKDARVEFRPAPGIDITVETEGNGITVQSFLHLLVVPIERGRFLIQPVSANIKN